MYECLSKSNAFDADSESAVGILILHDVKSLKTQFFMNGTKVVEFQLIEIVNMCRFPENNIFLHLFDIRINLAEIEAVRCPL